MLLLFFFTTTDVLDYNLGYCKNYIAHIPSPSEAEQIIKYGLRTTSDAFSVQRRALVPQFTNHTDWSFTLSEL